MELFKKGDKVEFDYLGKHYISEVRKVSDYGVHTKDSDGYFMVFHFNPTHHMQSPITDLKLIK
jgi:hypothetical protein